MSGAKRIQAPSQPPSVETKKEFFFVRERERERERAREGEKKKVTKNASFESIDRSLSFSLLSISSLTLVTDGGEGPTGMEP